MRLAREKCRTLVFTITWRDYMLNFGKVNLTPLKRAFVALPLAVLPALAPALAHAAPVPVDLSGWVENGFKGNNGAGTWTVQAGNDSVLQSINGEPTVFFEAGSNAQGTTLRGTIKVNTSGDDDFVGFFLGYQDGELNSTAADFWMIDWKQANQAPATVGLALSHVSGDIRNGGNADPTFWAHTGTVNEVQRATNLGSTGWADFQEYAFDLLFTSTQIQVKVDGVLELDYAGSFTDGAFGFYNYSQSNVLYAGITEEALPDPCDANPPGVGACPPTEGSVPVPGTLWLMALGILGLGQMRRKRA
ncbi:MAG TPA: PEP-CTERM sorting domain-containing protein [Accumulibacter sp.]|nr:PEP-CTERM sorting domain-containing protein [Accumulibacter sp.]